LSGPIRATLVDPQGLGTIQNNDAPPSLSIDNVAINEGNAGTADAVFTVSISEISGVDATVEFMTADGTAEEGTDYAQASGMLLFPAMSTTPQQIFVSVFGDTLPEPDETFLVNLQNPVDATLADGQGEGTILNDEGNFLVTTGPAGSGASNVRRYQGGP
jgi:hypothetical protein